MSSEPHTFPSADPENRAREMALLLRVVSAANRGIDVDELLTTSLETLRQVFPFDLAFFLLVDLQPPRVRLAHPFQTPARLIAALENLDIPSEFFAQVDNPYYGVYALSNLADEIWSLVTASGYQAPITVPLLANYRGLGILTLAADEGTNAAWYYRQLQRKDVLDGLGTQLGLALQRARLVEQLRKSEEELRTFIMQSQDGFWEASPDGLVTLVNPAALEIVGYSEDEVLGRRFTSLAVESESFLAALRQQLERAGSYADQRVRIRAKDGSIKTISQTVRAERDANGKIVRYQAILRDVTARARDEAELVRRADETRVLNEIGVLLSYPMGVEAALQHVCAVIASLTQMETIGIFLVDHDRPSIELVASHNVTPVVQTALARFDLLPEVFSGEMNAADAPGVLEYLIITKKMLSVEDIANFTRWDVSVLLEQGYRSGIGAPIRYGDDVYGAIFVGSHTPHSFSTRDASLLEDIALRLALAIRNKKLYDELQRQVAELEALARVGQLLSKHAESREAQCEAVAEIARVLGADMVTIHMAHAPPRAQDYFYRTAESSPVDVPTVEPILDYHRRVLDNLETLVIPSLDDPDVDAEQRDHLTSLGLAAYVGVPLGEQESALGILFVNQKTPRRWTRNEVRLIQTFARQIASARHNALLLHETRERMHELEGMSQMSELTASLIHETTLIDLALQLIKEILDVEIVSVHMLDENGEQFRTPQSLGANPGPTEPLRLTPLLHRVMESHKPFDLDALHQPLLDDDASYRVHLQQAHAFITAPLFTAERVIGLLTVGRRVNYVWSPSEVRSLQTMANQLATAIVNARLYQAQAERAHNLDLLAQLSRVSSSTLQPEQLLRVAVEPLRLMLNASQVSIRLIEDGQLTIGVGTGYAHPALREHRIPIDERLARLLAPQQMMAIPDLETFPDLPPSYVERKRAENARALLMVPLVAQEQVFGILSVFRGEVHRWALPEIQFASTVANTIALSLANARHFQSLQKERGELAATLDSVFSGVFTTDREGEIQTWNRAAEKITGFTALEMRGKNWADRVARLGDSQNPDLLVFEAMEEGNVVFGHANRTLLTADRREIPLMEAAAPLRDRDGKIRGAVVSFWDRSKEHQSEIAKVDFLTYMSHELRNSLTPILSMAELLGETNLPTPTRERAIRVVSDHVDRLKRLAKDLLEFETEKFRSASEDKLLNLGPLLRRLIEEIKLAHPELSFELSVRGGRVYADAERLETVLINLLGNAAKFSPRGSGSAISVKTRIVNKAQLCVAIHNEGEAIPPEEVENIFVRGFRAQLRRTQPVEGSGIGLWLVRGKLHEMGGEISVTSDSKGTTFLVTLRRTGGKRGESSQDDKTPGTHSGGGRRQTGRGRPRRHS